MARLRPLALTAVAATDSLAGAMTIAPTSTRGKLSVWLVIACCAVLAAAIIASLVRDPDSGGAAGFLRFIFGTSFLLTGAGGLIAAVVAIFVDRDRSAAVFCAGLLGLLAVAFALGDVIFP